MSLREECLYPKQSEQLKRTKHANRSQLNCRAPISFHLHFFVKANDADVQHLAKFSTKLVPSKAKL